MTGPGRGKGEAEGDSWGCSLEVRIDDDVICPSGAHSKTQEQVDQEERDGRAKLVTSEWAS